MQNQLDLRPLVDWSPDLNFTIRAIADRVDQRSDRSLVIYDYKTGVAQPKNNNYF